MTSYDSGPKMLPQLLLASFVWELKLFENPLNVPLPYTAHWPLPAHKTLSSYFRFLRKIAILGLPPSDFWTWLYYKWIQISKHESVKVESCPPGTEATEILSNQCMFQPIHRWLKKSLELLPFAFSLRLNYVSRAIIMKLWVKMTNYSSFTFETWKVKEWRRQLLMWVLKGLSSKS